MNSFVDEVLAGEPKYTIELEDGTILENVKINLSTNVVTQGTALNKAYFDSVEDDVNSRLLTANKATTAEAKAGTNTSKYIVPSTMQDKLNYMNTIKSGSITQSGDTAKTTTIFQPSDIGNATSGTVIIDGYCVPYGTANSGNDVRINFNGTSFSGADWCLVYNDGYTVDSDALSGTTYSHLITRTSSSQPKYPFKIEINLSAKTIKVSSITHFLASNSMTGMHESFFTYATLTNVQIKIKNGSSSRTASAYYNITYTR